MSTVYRGTCPKCGTKLQATPKRKQAWAAVAALFESVLAMLKGKR